jgi:alcohol dehydrogenase
MDFNIRLSTEILFGRNKLKDIGESCKKMGLKNVGIITDKGLANTDIIGRTIDILNKNGVVSVVYDAVKPNPTTENAHEAKKILMKNNCEGVIGIGGGSALDAAKVASVFVNESCDLKELASQPLDSKLPCIAVTTTSGTSAELTDVAVLSDPLNKTKFGIRHPRVAPEVAILDPELTLSLPRIQTRDSGIDALCHAVEAILSIKSSSFTDSCCLKAIELIGKNLRRAVFEPNNIEAREKMMEAQLLTGIGFHHAYLCLIHAIGTPIGGYYDISHGVANGIVMPETLKFLLPNCIEKLSRIYKALSCDYHPVSQRIAAEMTISEIEKLFADLEMPDNFSDYGSKSDDKDELFKRIENSYLIELSPRIPTKEELLALCGKFL